MKIGQSITFTHEVEGRIYTLVFPVPAPLGECYDVAVAVCNKWAKEIQMQEERSKATPETKEENGDTSKS